MIPSSCFYSYSLIQVLLVSQILIPFFEGLKKSEVKSIFSETDLSALAKVSLCLIAEMNSFYPAVTFLRAASEVIAKLEKQLITEWTKIDNIHLVYRAINSLLKLIVSFRNGLPLDQIELSGNIFKNSSNSKKVDVYAMDCIDCIGFEQSKELDSEFINCACRLSQMVTFLERQSKQLPEAFRTDLTYVSSFILLPYYCHNL